MVGDPDQDLVAAYRSWLRCERYADRSTRIRGRGDERCAIPSSERWVVAMPKYDPLGHWLMLERRGELVLSFREIEDIIGDRLPASASAPGWWKNARHQHAASFNNVLGVRRDTMPSWSGPQTCDSNAGRYDSPGARKPARDNVGRYDCHSSARSDQE